MQRRRRTLRRFATVGAFALLPLAACSGDDTTAETTVGESSDATSDADVEFAQGMIAHHEQAIEMAEIALDPNVGASADVVGLATRIKAAQDPEVEQMTAWLIASGESVAMDMSDGHDMSEMPGMMDAADMDALAEMRGAEFDTMWLEMMIAHHEGAIQQSQYLIDNGSDAELIALAKRIISAQQAEIDEMRVLLGA